VKPQVLLVDDDAATLLAFREYFTAAGYEIAAAASLAEARAALAQQRFDAVLLDDRLPDGFGMDFVPVLKERYPDTAAIIITGQGDVPRAVEAMRRGADHFLTKPVDLADVELFLRKELAVGQLRRRDLGQRLSARRAACFFGETAAMAAVRELARVAVENRAPVLIEGETGTGKGRLARWIHEEAGGRPAPPLVDINCAALRGELLANELFGHVRGAFTSAGETREGLLDAAHGGTLFLDEIGEMDPGVQTQLLKVIEEKGYRRLGDTTLRRSDFRLICATSRDLEEGVRAGRFRLDLLHRINLLHLRLPPLRERREDIPELCRLVLAELGVPPAPIDDGIMACLAAYPWPGNIRELRNVVERALMLARGGALGIEHFPGLDRRGGAEASAARPLRKLEQDHLAAVLKEHGGDARKAADALGLPLSTFYRKTRLLRQT
jgi:DNA-binding NtrC family response regulator